ncbi:hypothetical protein PLICRDRAFT_179532 [Plicaturopsis crispa FD-325 SS-3]|uniref:RNI-like protein n=1 Tax=Plicaturopsis crispa FD-325 SS-3 TaxID=944288 RepID=A0A0C9SXC9_PLICR|nr:hypothetical protein PLICRDRAFT_179532 [Plicaturopsis crispa FD-325 SS-3]
MSPSGVYRPPPSSRRSAPKVSLSGRSHVDRLDAGLKSVSGAQEIIAAICTRRLVTKLILGHNDLGDDGCAVLFKFLCSTHGKKYKIAEISLNSNGIGDDGLLAVAEYLRDNRTLSVLFLQNNVFTGDSSAMSTFVSALNTSSLSFVAFSTNIQLSDAFLASFLPSISSPHLRELHLSATGLTYRSGPILIDYISSPQCRLHTLKCNGNSLGLETVKEIVAAIEHNNFGLLRVEMYSNQRDAEQDNFGDIHAKWLETEQHLKKVLIRNERLRRSTESEALFLLCYARALLLRPTAHQDDVRCELFANAPPTHSPAHTSLFPFHDLPTELQLHILSFLAPSLSSAQRIRIYEYAASSSTLPQVLPKLHHHPNCIPDPSSMPFGMGGGIFGVTGAATEGCANGKCMGAGNSVLCKREEARARWLEEVRCSVYEPGPAL